MHDIKKSFDSTNSNYPRHEIKWTNNNDPSIRKLNAVELISY